MSMATHVFVFQLSLTHSSVKPIKVEGRIHMNCEPPLYERRVEEVEGGGWKRKEVEEVDEE